jgi:hypothetical protein
LPKWKKILPTNCPSQSHFLQRFTLEVKPHGTGSLHSDDSFAAISKGFAVTPKGLFVIAHGH